METIKVSYNVGKLLAQVDDIYQLRMLTWLLVKAQQSTGKIDKNLKDINLQFALEIGQIEIPLSLITTDKTHARAHVRRAFELQDKVFFADMKGAPVEIRAIAFPITAKVDGQWRIRYYIHRSLWLALLDFSKGWRKLNIASLLKIHRPTTMVLYFLISRQTSPQTYNSATLRNMLHLGPGYEKRSNFIARVLKPAQQELAQCDTTFDFTFSTISRTNHDDQITLTPRALTPERSEEVSQAADNMQHDLPAEVADYLTDKFAATPRDLATLTPLLSHHRTPYEAIDHIARIHTAALRAGASNCMGYLIAALQGKG